MASHTRAHACAGRTRARRGPRRAGPVVAFFVIAGAPTAHSPAANMIRGRVGLVGTFGAALCSLSSSTSAATADPTPARLQVARTPQATDCPDSATLAKAVADIEGRVALVTDDEPSKSVEFAVSFERAGNRYAANIQVSGARNGVRQIVDDAPTCAGLARAVAAHLALLIDESDVAPSSAAPAPAASLTERPPRLRQDSEGPSPVLAPTAPEPTGYNVVFVELLGNAGLASLNYERFFFSDGRLGVRVGAGIWPAFDFCAWGCTHVPTSVVFPLVASWYVGRWDHSLQLGAGIAVYPPPSLFGLPVLGTAVVGYRYHPRNRGYDFGLAFTPQFGPSQPGFVGFAPFAGVSLGAAF